MTFSTPEVYGRAITLGHFINVYQPPALMTGFKTYTYSPYLMVDDNDAEPGNNHVIRGTDYQEFLTGLFPMANSTLDPAHARVRGARSGQRPGHPHSRPPGPPGLRGAPGAGATRPCGHGPAGVTELDVTTFFISPGFIAPDMILPFQDTLAAIGPEMETLGDRVAGMTNRPPESWTAEDTVSATRYAALNRTAVIAGGSVVAGAFLLDSDYYLRVMRKSHLTLAYYDSPRITLFQAWTDRSTASPAMRMGLDLRRNHVFTLPYPGQNAFNRFTFNMAKGRVDSLLEYLTVEHFLAEDFPEVRRVASPIRALQEAKAVGVRVELLRGEYDIPTRLEPLDISAEAKARIANALRAGRQVNVPAQTIEVDGQPSIGWWEIDLKTGEVVAVGEDGGNQNMIEFFIILGVVAAGAILVLTVLGGNIHGLFGTSHSKVQKFEPFGAAMGNPTSGIDPDYWNPPVPDSQGDVDGIPVNFNADGSASFEINHQTVTIPASAMADLNTVFGASGGGASVVDFSGTHIEVLSRYAPGISDLTGQVATASGLQVETYDSPSFVVVQGVNQLPSTFRARVAYTGEPAPASMVNCRDRVGESFVFQVTGAVSGNIWGTDIYTYDSPLAKAAIHAGVVTNGQTATVKVTMLPSQTSYTGSTRNGVTSGSFGAYGPSYRFDPIVTATDQAVIGLSGSVPDGWNLLIARETNAIPAGVTNQVSLFLQPQEQTALPLPGTALPFSVQVARLDVPSAVITQQMDYVVSEIHGLLVEAKPETIYSSPDGSQPLELTLLNTGNVTQDVHLTLTMPTNFTATALATPLLLAPGQSATQTVTVTAQSAPVDRDYDGAFSVTYGPTNGLMKQVELLLHVAAPGSLQALNAANDAKALGRRGMATLLETLGKDLSRLYGEPTNEVYRSRVVADLTGLIQQLDDPLLWPFAVGLETARQNIAAATTAEFAAALENLGQVLTPFQERLALLADHDFEVMLQPNTAQTLPETPAAFGVSLKNKGRRTTTYQLNLSPLPPGIMGGLDSTNITLAPGHLSAPGVAGAGQTATVTLTQPAQQLMAFDFTVQVVVDGAPAITRAAHGAYVARQELVKVLNVEAAPPFVDPSPRTEVRAFTGGDEGEGLDLDGVFPFAVSFQASGTLGAIRDALFTADDAPGVQVQAQNWIDNWQVQNYGDTEHDNLLETVMRTARYNVTPTIPVAISLANLVPGQRYRLQLLFTENSYAAREFDVLVENQLVVDDLNVAGVQGGTGVTNRGVVVVHEFVAADELLNIALDARNVDHPDPSKQNPFICGLTLEALPGAQIFARMLNAVNRNRDVRLQYTVKNPGGLTVFTSPPQTAHLTTVSSLDTFALGSFDIAGLALGAHTIEVTVSEADGTPIPGAVGAGTLLVGSPVSATMRVSPEALPPGSGRVTVTLEVSSMLDYGSQGLALVGLRETTGTAESLALRGDCAYVGGSENVMVLNVANPRNPTFVHAFATGRRGVALSGEHLLVRNGSGLEMYGLGNPEQPNLLGTVTSGVVNVLIPDFHAHDGFAFMDTLVVGYDVNGGAVTLVRGDLLSFDIRNPLAPQSLGLLFNTPHVEQPDWPGSDFFMGIQSAVKNSTLFLPSTTAPGSGVNGVGRLVLVDLRTPGVVSTNGEFQIPDTRALLAVAVEGDRALVVGDTGSLGSYGLAFNGGLILTLLNVTNPAQPVILGHAALSNVTERIYYRGSTRVAAVQEGLYVMSGVDVDGQPALVFVDALAPANIVVRSIPVPAAVTWAEVRDNLLYTTSLNGLAIYDLGGWLGVPVTATVRVPNDGSAALVADSFNVPPDEILAGADFDSLVWNTVFSVALTNEIFTWQMDVADLQPGEAREVAVGGAVDFTAWGTEFSIALQPLRAGGEQILALEPGAQTVRPGEPVDFAVIVKNPSANPVTYDLALQGLPTDWVSLASPVTLPASNQVSQTLRVRSEAYAALGDYGFTVTARAAGGATYGAVHGVLTLAGSPLVTSETHGVVVSLDPMEATAGQGTPAYIKVRVTNTGNVTEACTLSAQLPDGIASDGPLSLDVLPGTENAREVRILLIPDLDTAPGAVPFSITAASPAVQATAHGTLRVLPIGFLLSLTPALGPWNTVFTARLANLSPSAETFDLAVGGPLAAEAALSVSNVTISAGGSATVNLVLQDAGFALAGAYPLHLGASLRRDPRVQKSVTASVEVPETRGVAIEFVPTCLAIARSGPRNALLLVQNRGNREESFRLGCDTPTGPFAVALHPGGGLPSEAVDALRLPALATGAILVQVEAGGFGSGTVRFWAVSNDDPGVHATAELPLAAGCGLRLGKELVIEMTFDPQPGVDHHVEFKDLTLPGLPWQELTGGPFNTGYYLLCTPLNCGRFTPDVSDAVNPFVDFGHRPQRYYRLRTSGGEPVNPRLRMVWADALHYDVLCGFDHVVQVSNDAVDPASWRDLPNGPHNGGLVIYTQVHNTRFFRVRLMEPNP